MYDEWISYWAKVRPGQVAVVLPSEPVRYGQFDQQINKVAARLAALNLAGPVAVHMPDEYVHWLLMLALDRLGLASVSIGMPAPQHPILAALKPDLVLTNADGAGKTSFRSLAVTREWYDETMAQPACARPQRRASPGDIVRFFSSSGTTGTAKLMAITRAQNEARVDQARTAMAAGQATRSCTLLGITTAGAHTWPLGYWSAGGSVVLNMTFSKSLAESLRRTQPTQLVTSVGTLLDLVRGPAADLPPMPSLEVFIVGSALPKALADEARRVLSPHVNASYASTEVSGIAIGSTALLQQHDGTAGVVFPGTEIEAVDDDERPLPPGTMGVLRARNACMITGYLNEDAKSADSAIRNGWFYSGDVGSVSADGIVVVAGRVNDVINIGGNKFFPQAIEETALACAGIRDAAVFAVPDKLGVEAPWIAVVRGDDHKPGEVVASVKARWPQLGPLQVAVTTAIPRNQMGKIDRQTLRQQAMTSTKEAAGR